MSETTTPRPAGAARRAGWAVGLLTAGAIGGAALGVLPAAFAQDSAPAPSTPSAEAPATPGERPGRSETPLTGDVAASVEEAVLAAHPGATVDRLETNDGGESAYEAHLTTAEGERLTVFVDESFAVVGEEAGRGGRGPGGPGGRGGDCPEPGGADDSATTPEPEASAEGTAFVA